MAILSHSVSRLSYHYKVRTNANKETPNIRQMEKGLKIRSILAATILIVLSLFLKEPYQQLVCLGLIFEAVSLLPIFYKEEETLS